MTIGFVGLAGLGLAGALAVIDWIAVARANESLERRAKPAVMAILIAAVLISDPDASPRSVLLAIALATSLTGDWLLLPPVHFEKGLLAFFFAHLAYLGALLVGPLHPELALVGAAGWWLRSSRRMPRRAKIAMVALLPLLLWSHAAGSGPPGSLTVTFFDVGQGDAALIRSPGFCAVQA